MRADQPATLAQPNIAGVRSAGMPATSSTTAAQYSTFVSSWRSGDFSRRTLSAASSSAAATSTRGDPSSIAVRLSTRARSEEHTSELQSRQYLVCRLLLEKKNV